MFRRSSDLCHLCPGVSAAFAVKLFKSWINEKDINSVAGSLRKVGMDNRLMVSKNTSRGPRVDPFLLPVSHWCVNILLLLRNSFRPTNGAASIFRSTSPMLGWRSCLTSPATSNPSAPARSCRRSSRSRCPEVTLWRRWGHRLTFKCLIYHKRYTELWTTGF